MRMFTGFVLGASITLNIVLLTNLAMVCSAYKKLEAKKKDE